jgi:DNA-binding winged helix-turn-helix (wHTH) protein
VDVHVRRLRAKLGTEHEQMIGTVRNVGYKFVRPSRSGLGVPAGAVVEDDGEEGDDGERAHARINGIGAHV